VPVRRRFPTYHGIVAFYVFIIPPIWVLAKEYGHFLQRFHTYYDVEGVPTIGVGDGVSQPQSISRPLPSTPSVIVEITR
jgi:hypothetical protein